MMLGMGGVRFCPKLPGHVPVPGLHDKLGRSRKEKHVHTVQCGCTEFAS